MKTRNIILSLEKVNIEFNGFPAVRDMSMVLEENELRFLIGPNGAGKTTLLDVICGKVKPVSGKVMFRNETDITKKPEHQIAELGISRKFQAPSIFPSLTVLENLLLSIRQDRRVLATLFSRVTKENKESIYQQMEMIGLADKRCKKAGSLAHGEKQWLEIGMMLIQAPKVLLLDEPVAGMTDKETERTGHLLREVSRQCSVVVVEHDMDFVRDFSSKVTVMHEGALLTEGTMEEVQRNERVAEVYLGKKVG